MRSRANTILAAALIVLAAAVIVQGFTLYRLVRQDGEAHAASGPKLDLAPRGWDPFQGTPLAGPHWDPIAEVERTRARMDALFDRLDMAPAIAAPGSAFTLEDTGDAYVAELPLPPGERREVDVRIEGNVLIITGSGEGAQKEHGPDQTASRKLAATFERRVSLPGPVRPATLRTDIEKGVLRITVDKRS